MENNRYNPEGYRDDTAYDAIKNTEGWTSQDPPSPEEGEIWATNNGREALIVKTFAAHVVTLTLTESPGQSKIPVSGSQNGSTLYTNPGMPGYIYNTNCTERISVLSETQYAKVREAFADALGLYTEQNEPIEKIDISSSGISIPLNGSPKDEIEKAVIRAERDVFKGLYEDLLRKVMNNG